jgi:hypothetical protein
MNIIKSSKPQDDKAEKPTDAALATIANVEGEIREFVKRDVVVGRKPQPQQQDQAELGAGNINFLIERVAGSSIREIDNLIAQLQSIRDYLRAEGERVQREIASYANASQTAMASAKIIVDSMAEWKSAASVRQPDRE